VVAYWRNGSDIVTEYTAAINAGARYPSFSQAVTNLESNEQDKQALTIICSSRVDLTSSLQNSNDHQTRFHMSAEKIAQIKDKTIDNGIEIDTKLWQEINQIGAAVLVENSEESRQGAGAN
jgi:hypothetical protein